METDSAHGGTGPAVQLHEPALVAALEHHRHRLRRRDDEDRGPSSSKANGSRTSASKISAISDGLVRMVIRPHTDRSCGATLSA